MKTPLVIGALILAAVLSGAQAPVRDQARPVSTGSASVTGVIYADDAARAPLRRVILTLSRANIEDIRTIATDDEGHYTFSNLPAGSYTLSASKGAYISMSYGAARPGMPGSPIVLTEGQTFVAQPIALMRGAVIAGRLLDRMGQPASNITVEATPLIAFNGERRRRSTRRENDAQTNAHGEYRIFGLLPGEYLVATSTYVQPAQAEPTAAEIDWANRQTGTPPAPSRAFVLAPTVFPGTAEAARGVPIILERGEERLGVDFAVQSMPVARISGNVATPDGQVPREIAVMCMLKTPSPLLPAPPTIFGRPMGDGSFACAGLPPGRYLVVARGVPNNLAPAAVETIRSGIALPPLWGSVEIDVAGRDIADILLSLNAGISVAGQVVFKGATPFDPKRVQVRLMSAERVSPVASNATAVLAPDGTFQVDGLAAGTYRIVATATSSAAGAGPSLSLKSAMLGGNDVADVPFELNPNQNVAGLVVTFSGTQAEVAGTLTAAAGSVAPQLYVFVFPTDKTLWLNAARRIRYVRSADNGSYSIPGLPPGEYYLSALTELETALQYEPGYLEQLVPSAIKITLAEGEKKRQDLRIGG